MGKIYRKSRSRRLRRYSSSVRTVKSVSGVTPRRGSGGGSSAGTTLIMFLRRNIRFVAVGAVVLAAAIVCLILFTGGGAREVASTQTPAATTPSQSVSAIVTDYSTVESYSYEGVDSETLAGLAGTDEELFYDDPEMQAALLEAEGVRVGVTVKDLPTEVDQALLNRMEALSNEAESARRIYRAYYRNAGGSGMQQIQDVHSLINEDVDIIIIGATDAVSFEKVCFMAAEADIPVVAYDAPVTEGYVVNVVTDQQAWGAVYGDFVARLLDAGNVLQVLGSAEDADDQLRAQGIADGLSANPNLVLLDTVYASWDEDDACDAIKTLLEDGAKIDAVITEEGMAEGILDAFIEAGSFPEVMCGDVTAGFIKEWYALKHDGYPVEVEKKHRSDPEPKPMMLIAPFSKLNVCAQPAPYNAGAVAFEIAVRIAEGRTLKEEGVTFTYSIQTLINGANFSQYYEMVKDYSDSAVVNDVVTDAMLEDLFELAAEESAAVE